MAVRTHVLLSQTPMLPVKLTRDHLSVIGAITQFRRLFMQIQEQAYVAKHVARFLRLLLREISDNLLLI